MSNISFDDLVPQNQNAPQKNISFDDLVPQTGMFDVVTDQALQGGTFGLGNRAQAGLAALALSAMNDKGLAQNYEDARNYQSQKMQLEMQQHPVASIASNLAGGLATGNLLGDTAAGSSLADWLGSGNTAARVAKGIGTGAASGAAYGAGTADYGKTLEGAKQGAVTGAVTGGALPVAGAALSDVGSTLGNAIKGITAKSPEAVQQIAQNFKNNAGDLYNNVDATFNPEASTDLLNKIKQSLASQGFLPSLNPKTLGIVNDLDNIVAQAATGGDLKLSTLDQIRRQLGRIAPTEDGVSAGKIRSVIDDFVNGAGQSQLSEGSPDAINTLNQARKQYQQASKFQDISDILTKADGNNNKIKSALTNFLNTPNNTRGWTDDEINALKNVKNNTTTESINNFLAKLSPHSLLGGLAGGTAGWGLGGATGAIALPAAGMAAKGMQNLITEGKVQNLLDTIQNGASKTASPSISGLLSIPTAQTVQQLRNISNEPQLSQNIEQIPSQQQNLSYDTQQPMMNDFAKAESNNNPNARNPYSSASGLLQFTNKTWADMVGKYGKSTGIGLQDKNNPQAQQIMGNLLAQDNAKYITSKLGRQPNEGEVYMAHVFGPQETVKLINAQGTGKQAILLFPRADVQANRSIFFNRNKPRTVEEVYNLLNSKV